jgi:hypothetical protein
MTTPSNITQHVSMNQHPICSVTVFVIRQLRIKIDALKLDDRFSRAICRCNIVAMQFGKKFEAAMLEAEASGGGGFIKDKSARTDSA